jgi:hypothetical protein
VYLVILKIFTAFLCVCLFTTQALATTAKIYVWRDKNGQLVYSDTPEPGAEEVTIKDPNISSSRLNTSVLDITPKVIKEQYQVEITQPESNATIRDNTGSVAVTARVKPIFKRGLTVQLLLDGRAYAKPQKFARFILRNIDRGEHQLKVQILNEQGKVIALSKPITFYMHRISVNKAK